MCRLYLERKIQVANATKLLLSDFHTIKDAFIDSIEVLPISVKIGHLYSSAYVAIISDPLESSNEIFM